MNDRHSPHRWLPPEWAAQQFVVLTWPHDRSDWGDDLEAADSTFRSMAHAIASEERLVIACRDQAHREHVAALLGQLSAATFCIAPSNDIWVRDHGPITVIRDGRLELLDFRFNGWGNRYPADLDNRVTATLVEAGAFADFIHTPVDAVLEGGSVETDGEGTVLLTSRCLLHPSRNGAVDRDWVEARMQEWFGCAHVLWLDHGRLEGDDTDGHVDMLARFAPGRRILYTACDDPADSHHEELAAMAAQLREFRNRDGDPYTPVALPWPPALHDSDGKRLPLSYANFLVINGAVLVPVYGVDTDRDALTRIAEAFPGRQTIPINALPLVRQHGGVHCATMQVPFAAR